ncbi:DUF3040 domain-containing protein [Actinocatenispora rupis]|uniref:DUF3040 domain-containing protein n=1 Tax=Actinocatenispora rupis TaxID=519421 RepID=A0A8J3NAT8_9ACTN|nr:DUF3040 domain-containing protein [Actinocatenispora rupis]GID12441.1 hypothetical protein Aru02nite_33300 [Actinocatenispora rupis]
MLNQQERRLLDEIDRAATATDHRFADGLRRGRPRLPREHRYGRIRVLTGFLLLLVLPVCGVLIAHGNPLGVLAAWPAIVGVIWGFGARQPDRHDEPDRGRPG